MQTVKVCVLPYDPVWKQDFGNSRPELTKALGHLTLRIEHIGSSPEKYTFLNIKIRSDGPDFSFGNLWTFGVPCGIIWKTDLTLRRFGHWVT